MKNNTGNAALLRTISQAAFAVSVLSAILIQECGVTNPPTTDTPAKTGTPAVYTVPSGSNPSVLDTVTGATLSFPGSGGGTVTITKVEQGVNVPSTGTVFTVDCPRVDSVHLQAPASGAYAMYGFGKLQTTPDDSIGNLDRWVSLPAIDSNNGKMIFSLLLPVPAATAKAFAGTKSRIGSHPGFRQFWMTQLTPTSDDETKLAIYNQQVWQLIVRCIDSLPDAMKARCESEANVRLHPQIVLGGNWYDGFGFRCPGLTPSVKPVISFTSDAKPGNIAHETGHYLNHVLAGDAVFLTLQNQDPGSNHGIGTAVADRAVILEDYAYFFEYFFTGVVGGSLDPTNPRNIFRDMSPLVTDFPGIEGFGCALLGACQRESPQIPNILTGQVQKVPVAHMSFKRLLGVVAAGATNIDALRSQIESAMTASERAMMPVLCQSIGWYYGVTGKVVDKSGSPLSGIAVSSISRVDTTVYDGGSTLFKTGGDGVFNITTGVFSGTSLLRAIKGTDTSEIPITISYTEPTTKTINLGLCTLSTAELSLTSIKPDSAVIGASVTLRGTGFSVLNDSCKVWFGAKAVSSFTSWTDTSITVTVPVVTDSTMLVKVQIRGKTSNMVVFKALADMLPVISAFAKIGVFFHADMLFNGVPSYHSALGSWGKLTWSGSSFTASDSSISTTGQRIFTITGEVDPTGRKITTATMNGLDEWMLDDTTTMRNISSLSIKNIPFWTKVDSTMVIFKRETRAILDSNLVSASSVTTKNTPSGSTVTSHYDGPDLTYNNPMDLTVEFDKK